MNVILSVSVVMCPHAHRGSKCPKIQKKRLNNYETSKTFDFKMKVIGIMLDFADDFPLNRVYFKNYIITVLQYLLYYKTHNKCLVLMRETPI